MASILTSTKKTLGLEADYTNFDADITMYINAAFSTLDQLGVGPDGGFFIEDATAEWADFDVPENQVSLVKAFVHLSVRILFDPPHTSYLINAMEEQIKQFTWRLNHAREILLPPTIIEVVIP